MQLAILSGLIVLGIVILYLLLRRRMDQLVASRDPDQDLKDELSSILMEINRTTEQNVILLEDRISQLREIMAEADKRIRIIRRENEKNDVSRQVYTGIVRQAAEARQAAETRQAGSPQAGPPQASPSTDSAGVPQTEGTPGDGPSQDQETGERPEPASSQDAETETASSDEPSLDVRVLRLSREGFGAADIAARVGATVGEVELIISLNRHRS
jgi:hypothetical protein